MSITYPIPDADLVAKLNHRLEEFRKLRIGYVDPSLSVEEQEEVKKEAEKVVKVVKKRTLIEKFFFSEYE